MFLDLEGELQKIVDKLDLSNILSALRKMGVKTLEDLKNPLLWGNDKSKNVENFIKSQNMNSSQSDDFKKLVNFDKMVVSGKILLIFFLGSNFCSVTKTYLFVKIEFL